MDDRPTTTLNRALRRQGRVLLIGGLVFGLCLLVVPAGLVAGVHETPSGSQQASADQSTETAFQQSNTTAKASEISYLLGDGSERSSFYTGGEIIVVGPPIDAAHAAGDDVVSLRVAQDTEDGEITSSRQETTLEIETAFENVPFAPEAAETPDGEPPTAFVQIPDDQGLSPGEYFVRDSDGRVAETRANTVEIVTQSLSADWDEEGEIEADRNETTELEIDSNRATYNVNVSAPGVEYEQLESLFLPEDASNEWIDTNAPWADRAPFADTNGGQLTGDRTADRLEKAARYADEDVIVLQGQNGDSLKTRPANAELDAGTIDFNLSATDSNATTTAPLTVTDTDANAAFTRSRYRQPAGSLVEMTVELEGTESTYLVLGDTDSGYVDIVYLEDDTGDDTVEFVINTRLIGTQPDAEPLGGDDAFRSESDIVRSLDATSRTAPPSVADEVFAGLQFEDADGDVVTAETNSTRDGSLQAFREALGIGALVRPIQPTGYDLRLTTDGVLSIADDRLQAQNSHELTRLELTEPEPTVTTYVAPQAEANNEPLSALQDRLTPRETVAFGDRLVLEIGSGSYAGALSAAAVETDAVTRPEDILTDEISTEAVDRLTEIEGEGITIEFVETSQTGNRSPDTLQLNQQNEEAAVAYLDPETQALYIVIDTRERDALFDRTLRDGTTYTARIAYTADATDRYRFITKGSPTERTPPFNGGADGDSGEESYPYLKAGESIEAEAPVTFATPTAQLQQTTNGTALIERKANATLSGTTNIAPGTAIQFQIDGLKSKNRAGTTLLPFSTANETTVRSNETISTPVDTTGGTLEQQLRVKLRAGSRSITTIDGRLVTTAAAVSLPNQSVDWQLNTVTIEQAGLPEGGFIGIHDARFLDGERGESLRGVTRYLEPGTVGPINITLEEPYRSNGTAVAVVYTDTGSQRTFEYTETQGIVNRPYLSDGTPVLDRAAVTISEPSGSADMEPQLNETAAARSANAGTESPTSAARPDRTAKPPLAGDNANNNSDAGSPMPSPEQRSPEEQSWFSGGAAVIALAYMLWLKLRR